MRALLSRNTWLPVEDAHLLTLRPPHVAHSPRPASSDAAVPLCLEAAPTAYVQPRPIQQALQVDEPAKT